MTTGPALLLVAHGSRRAEANAEVARFADRLREAAGARFARVAHAFLELGEPDIPTGVDACVLQGVTQVQVLPYFLAAGRHVADDVPGLLAEARARHPDTPILLYPHLGSAQGLPKFVLDLVEGSRLDGADPV